MTVLDEVVQLRKQIETNTAIIGKNGELVAAHEEQISGKGGLQSSIEELSAEVRSLRKAAYWVGGLIVAGSVSFAFSVLALVGHG